MKGHNTVPENDDLKPPPPSKPHRNDSKDGEIKTQMAKDILCSILSSGRSYNAATRDDLIETVCYFSGAIFNRFNK